jgi:hypothetical protein
MQILARLPCIIMSTMEDHGACKRAQAMWVPARPLADATKKLCCLLMTISTSTMLASMQAPGRWAAPCVPSPCLEQSMQQPLPSASWKSGRLLLLLLQQPNELIVAAGLLEPCVPSPCLEQPCSNPCLLLLESLVN